MSRLFNAALLCGFLSLFATAAHAAKYDRLYVFGDSFSDMGAGYLDGNGPTAVAYLAQNLGTPMTHSRDPKANSQSIDFAVTAATSGENAGKPAGEMMFAVGMLTQVKDFAARVRAKKIRFNPDTTLFFIEGGLNDSDVPVKTTLANLTKQVQILKNAGAKHITVSILPTRIPDFADTAKKLNPEYRTWVETTRKKLGVDLTLNRFGEYLDDILQNPSNYGIANTEKACAGRALFNEDPTPCKTPDAYFYYHAGHPSTAVNKIVGQKLHAELTGASP